MKEKTPGQFDKEHMQQPEYEMSNKKNKAEINIAFRQRENDIFATYSSSHLNRQKESLKTDFVTARTYIYIYYFSFSKSKSPTEKLDYFTTKKNQA